MNDRPSQSSILSRRRKLTRRERAGLTGLVLFAFVALIVWKPLQREFVVSQILRSDAPSPEVLSDVVQQTGNRKSLLSRLWQTQRIPHRQFVLGYLGRTADREPDLFRAMEPVVLDATADADITTRELAFAALTRMKHPQLRQRALEQLGDVDPAARVLGLQSLRSVAGSNELPIVVHLLDDPDPRVVVAAALVLRQATGNDFGIKSSLALPRFTSIDNSNPPPSPDLAAIHQGVQRWRDWWKDHQPEYPASAQLQPEPRYPAHLTMSDFSLEDSDGKLVHLSDYHGRTVLLAFWALDVPVSLDDNPSLSALAGRNADSVAVVGICVPPAPSCADEDEGGEHAHHHHHGASAPSLETEQGRASVRQTILERKINFPMLLDSKGIVARRFDVEDLPTYVLIDAQGVIRRRFVGNRTEPVLGAIIHEVSDQKTARTETR